MLILRADELSRVTEAITAAEAGTDAEIVVEIARQSGSYVDVHAAAAACAAVVAQAMVLYSPIDFHEPTALLFPIVSAALVFAAARALVPRMWLHQRASTQVTHAAHAAFSRRGVYRTRGRTGVLLYYSHAERQGRILFDMATAQHCSVDDRAQFRLRLNEAHDVQALTALIADVGALFAIHLPQTHSVNELDDTVGTAVHGAEA